MNGLSKEIQSSVLDIKKQIETFLENGLSLFLSSSFQSHSLPLLHVIAQIDCSIPVYFLNTGFHFPETLLFVKEISTLLNINVVELSSHTQKSEQLDKNGRFFYCSNPDYCCSINKVIPMERAMIEHDIWITGVRREQNSNRQKMETLAAAPFDTLRYQPFLDWTSKMIYEYKVKYDLPEHPLSNEGYLSVGCEPCTSKFLDTERDGRWVGQSKNECGLHTDLITR